MFSSKYFSNLMIQIYKLDNNELPDYYQMNDQFPLTIPQQSIHKVLTHQGLLGKGRDFLSGNTCSLHLYNDKYKKTYIMQQYNDINKNFLTQKISRINSIIFNYYICNITKICFISTHQNTNGLFNLCIFYDTTYVYGYSLQYIIKVKIKNQQKFTQDQITQFFWQISDFLLFCGQSSGQYLEITPVNIFCKPDHYYHYHYFPNNFGLNFDNTKWERKYYHPNDRFWMNQKTLQSAAKASMFIFGMVLLQLCSLLSPTTLYNGNEINQKALKKRIQAIKLINNPQICSVISSLLNLNEDQRLTIKQIYENKQLLKSRKIDYYQNKIQYLNYKQFQGIIFFDQKHAIGKAIINQLNIQKGNFQDGKLNGLGYRQNKQQFIHVGIFQKGIFKQGIIFYKNNYVIILSDSQNKIKKGILIKINTNINKNQNKIMIAFQGEFQKYQPSHGKMYFSDGSQQQI